MTLRTSLGMVAVVAVLGMMAVTFGHGDMATSTATSTTTPAVTSIAIASSTNSTTSTSQTTYQDGTYTGSAASHKYGSVQVSVTIKNGKITSLDTPVMPSGDRESAEISDFAGAQLIDETLAAQSSQIASVSGATLTSRAYRTSLQSALDQAS